MRSEKMSTDIAQDLSKLNENPAFTILLIEDMPEIRQTMISNLRDLNFKGKIIEADCITKAKSLLNTAEFNLVICDMNLPDGLGLDFIAALRGHAKFSKIPLIMCTTVSDIKPVVNALKQGANDYIIKPWGKKDLVRKVLSVTAPPKK